MEACIIHGGRSLIAGWHFGQYQLLQQMHKPLSARLTVESSILQSYARFRDHDSEDEVGIGIGC